MAAVGCKQEAAAGGGETGGKLTPIEYWNLSTEEKADAKTVHIYVPEIFGYGEVPIDRGPWKSPVDKLVHEGLVDFFTYNLNRSLFELRHPHVIVEPLAFPMWDADFLTTLTTSLSAKDGPSMYIARGLPDTMESGLYKDITAYLDDWPEARDHRLTQGGGVYDGRVYCLPGEEQAVDVVLYRKDYFAEAGIINEFGEPGPPTDWTWDQFREFARRLIKRNADGRVERWGFVGKNDRFDNMIVTCKRIPLYVPDKTGENTWRFNADDPRLIEAMRAIRAMYREDESVRVGQDFNWAIAGQEFEAGRAAMANMRSVHGVMYFVDKPYLFGADIDARKVIGMALLPTDRFGAREHRMTTNLYGFNPTYSEAQTRASIAWFRSWACGEIRANMLNSQRQFNEIMGWPNPYPRYLLVRAYEPEVEFPPHPGTDIFPPDFRRVIDAYRKAELVPQPIQFGLREPVQLPQAMTSVYSECLFSQKDVAAILRDSAAKINHNCMRFKVEGDKAKLKAYYDAYLDYARRTMPPEAAAELQTFIETRCRVW